MTQAPIPVIDQLPATRDPRPGLSGLDSEILEAWFVERGEPAYRARQVADAVWGRQATSVGQIRTIPAALRDELDTTFRFDTVGDTEIRLADGGLTEKALHRLIGCCPGRVGPDALSGARDPARAAHAVHLEPGGLRGRLPVLCDG